MCSSVIWWTLILVFYFQVFFLLVFKTEKVEDLINDSELSPEQTKALTINNYFFVIIHILWKIA